VRLVLLFVLLVGCERRPTRAVCSTYLEYVRSDGRFRCAGVQDSRNIGIVDRIYCTGGTHPVRVDAKTVGCQR